VAASASPEEAPDEDPPDVPAPPQPPSLRLVSNGSTPSGGPSPEKPAALWSPPPLPSVLDVANHKLRPVASSAQHHRGEQGSRSASGDAGNAGAPTLLKELATLQLRSRSGRVALQPVVQPKPWP